MDEIVSIKSISIMLFISLIRHSANNEVDRNYFNSIKTDITSIFQRHPNVLLKYPF